MKVGTDGVLLGLLSPVAGTRFLDIGTGSGLVALLLAERAPGAHVTGIDIDDGAVCQAAENFRASPWAGRLLSLKADAAVYAAGQAFDLIACNPPYYENSPDSSDASRDAARRADRLSHTVLVAAVRRLLAAEGRFSVILPSGVSGRFVFLCWQSGLYLCERHLIYTKPGKPCKREVLVFSRTRIPTVTHRLTLADADGSRSSAYARLVEDFFIR